MPCPWHHFKSHPISQKKHKPGNLDLLHKGNVSGTKERERHWSPRVRSPCNSGMNTKEKKNLYPEEGVVGEEECVEICSPVNICFSFSTSRGFSLTFLLIYRILVFVLGICRYLGMRRAAGCSRTTVGVFVTTDQGSHRLETLAVYFHLKARRISLQLFCPMPHGGVRSLLSLRIHRDNFCDICAANPTQPECIYIRTLYVCFF